MGNVQGGCACECPRGGCFPIFLFRRADDVTRTMSKGVCACECPRVGAFFKLMTSRGQCPRGGGVRLGCVSISKDIFAKDIFAKDVFWTSAIWMGRVSVSIKTSHLAPARFSKISFGLTETHPLVFHPSKFRPPPPPPPPPGWLRACI